MPPGGITEAEIEAFLDYLFRTSNLVPFVLHHPEFTGPGRRAFWNGSTVPGKIITHNKKDFVGTDGFAVRTPAEFLKMLREHK
jgi:hypothetical protein